MYTYTYTCIYACILQTHTTWLPQNCHALTYMYVHMYIYTYMYIVCTVEPFHSDIPNNRNLHTMDTWPVPCRLYLWNNTFTTSTQQTPPYPANAFQHVTKVHVQSPTIMPQAICSIIDMCYGVRKCRCYLSLEKEFEVIQKSESSLSISVYRSSSTVESLRFHVRKTCISYNATSSVKHTCTKIKGRVSAYSVH